VLRFYWDGLSVACPTILKVERYFSKHRHEDRLMEEKRAEHRKHPRKKVSMRVEVRLNCGVIVDGAALDLSHGGLLFETERMLPLDCTVKVRLVRGGDAREHHIECHGTVCRIDSRGVAVMFDEMCADSAARLGNLLRMDGEAVEEPALCAVFAGEYY
jgi:hypothetical protein